ncbi:hypothetical protein [Desulfonema magnum]|uniref:EF Hand-containing n=1 Tax=Desulfonema magnum TaxID=45655 RepID=A0A975BUA6_9BACT|nr:hypothetical protein [Desulfonema magnum]QTA91864.1 EF Hand-containing [Desulfonema magnum]
MNRKPFIMVVMLTLVLSVFGNPYASFAADNPNPPSSPVKLIFIHHSTGGHWLADSNNDGPYGGLGTVLRDNNYYVSATNYCWGPDEIGSRTDIINWPEWFTGSNRDNIMNAVYDETGQNFTDCDGGNFGSWPRLSSDPGGENEIIMFKSCFPNSDLYGDPNDLPLSSPNDQFTVANAKAVYNNLLTYFETRQDKLFVIITAPPMSQEGYTANDVSTPASERAANARAFNNWLRNDWLGSYPCKNVAVFDYYNVLTSNGGNSETNDTGQESGNHHRWHGGQVQHTQSVSNNYSAYPSVVSPDWADDHPTTEGQQKATAEFADLLNVFYHRWKDGGTGSTTTSTTPGTTTTTVITITTTTTTTIGTTTTTSSGETTTTTTIISASRTGLRLYPRDIVYKGAFAYPEGDEWGYGGHALAYYPFGDSGGADDGYPGSFYTAGNATTGLVGEISIPEPVMSDDFNALPKASVLQSPMDITGGLINNCTYCEDCEYRNVDGLEYLPNINKIVWNLRDWYNVTACDQDSLGWSDPDMTGPRGVWHIGKRPSDNYEFHNGKTCDYLFKAPEDFADEYLDGKRLIAGNHRESGTYGGSQGPTLFAVAPWKNGNPPENGQNLDALAMTYYRERLGCAWNESEEMIPNPTSGACDFPDYRAMDSWTGGAWVQSGGISAILIFGRKSAGNNCYGTQEACGDPCNMDKGYHAYPYETQILFYDPEDLKAVISGTKEPWQVMPYDRHSLSDRVIGGECATLGAAAYDEENGLIYVTEQEAGQSGEPVVHVWKVVPFASADTDNNGKIELTDIISSLKQGKLRDVILSLRLLAGF